MDSHIELALRLDGTALAGDDEISGALSGETPAWLHLRADAPETRDWIDANLGHLDPSVRAALTEPLTRPRALSISGGLLLVLRAMNLNEGSDPEDMVSLRIWVDERQVVSLSRQRLVTVREIAARVRSGAGPQRPGALVAMLVDVLTDRIEAHVDAMEVLADGVEARVIADPETDLGAWVADQRLELTELRRFVPPQRDALMAAARTPDPALTEPDRRALAEQADQTARVAETLDALREQIHAIRDETERARADRLNHDLYVLSVISAVFLPLGFLTGLMGINIAGMPGTEWEGAFWTFTAGLVGLVAAQLGALAMLRRRAKRRRRPMGA